MILEVNDVLNQNLNDTKLQSLSIISIQNGVQDGRQHNIVIPWELCKLVNLSSIIVCSTRFQIVCWSVNACRLLPEHVR